MLMYVGVFLCMCIPGLLGPCMQHMYYMPYIFF